MPVLCAVGDPVKKKCSQYTDEDDPRYTDELCVQSFTAGNNGYNQAPYDDYPGWGVLSCSAGRTEFFCNVPTESPTTNPTMAPTISPTVEPTESPTQEPSIQPTTEPTVEPTDSPSYEPTVEPTDDPTFDPTIAIAVDQQTLTVMQNIHSCVHLFS